MASLCASLLAYLKHNWRALVLHLDDGIAWADCAKIMAANVLNGVNNDDNGQRLGHCDCCSFSHFPPFPSTANRLTKCNRFEAICKRQSACRPHALPANKSHHHYRCQSLCVYVLRVCTRPSFWGIVNPRKHY